jgi:hypothetical protein
MAIVDEVDFDFSIEESDHFKPNFDEQLALNISGENNFYLIGYDLVAKPEGDGGVLYLSLHWLATNRMYDQPVLVQLIDDQEDVLAEDSATPIYPVGEYPWRRVTHHSFELSELAATKLRLLISVQGAQPIVIDDVLNKTVIRLD